MTAQQILADKRCELAHPSETPFTHEELGKSWAWVVLYNAGEHLAGRGPFVRTDFGHIFGWVAAFEARRKAAA